MYTMPKNLLSICVNFTLATQPSQPQVKKVLTTVAQRSNIKHIDKGDERVK